MKSHISIQKKMSRYMGRLTGIFCDTGRDGTVHHFILGFEVFHDRNVAASDEKLQLTQYYDR